MYISKYKGGITVFGGEQFNLFSSEDFIIEVKGNKYRPPFNKVFKPASQELLKKLYNEGSRYVEFVEDEESSVEELESEVDDTEVVSSDVVHKKRTRKKVNKFS